MRIVLAAVLAMSSFAGLLAGASTAQSELVIVREGTKEYHTPGCEVIRDGKGVLAMTRAQAEGRKFTQHDACDPAKAPPEAPAATGPTGKTGGKPSAETMVWVDGGRHYHKEDCKRLDQKRTRMALDEAGRKFWPCTTCKPPIRPRKGAR